MIVVDIGVETGTLKPPGGKEGRRRKELWRDVRIKKIKRKKTEKKRGEEFEDAVAWMGPSLFKSHLILINVQYIGRKLK